MSKIGESAARLESAANEVADDLSSAASKISEVAGEGCVLDHPWRAVGNNVEDARGAVVAMCCDSAHAEFIAAAAALIMELDE